MPTEIELLSQELEKMEPQMTQIEIEILKLIQRAFSKGYEAGQRSFKPLTEDVKKE